MAQRFGPGFLVAAAFIGPGTVTTAGLAGARHGYELAWALLFAVGATLVLQEMASRLGVVSGEGLGEALRTGPLRWLSATLIVLAIGVGNAAYQGGNLTGAAVGLGSITGGDPRLWVAGCAVLAAVLLWTGTYRRVATVLTVAVATMSLFFLLAAIAARPDPAALFAALARPRLSEGAGLLALALVGTTVVPYNLFLHAGAAAREWRGTETATALRAARRDGLLAILLGGAVTLAILVSAVPLHAEGVGVDGVGALARSLEPILGRGAQLAFAAGLAAAGLTSATTAPLAAAWAVAGLCGWPSELRDRRQRAIWIAVLSAGTLVALTGIKPLAVILVAQAANGLLLPLVALFLWLAVNDRERMGRFKNGVALNIVTALVLLLVVALGLRQLGLFG